MSREEIVAILRAKFPPRPASLEPGEWYHCANGCSVIHSAAMSRYVAYDRDGTARGFRPTLDAAIDLADALPPIPSPRTRPEPAPTPAAPDVFAAERELAANIDASIRRSQGEKRLRQRSEIVERRRRGGRR